MANAVSGTSGNDVLTDKLGMTLAGGLGDDTYQVSSRYVQIIEEAGGGVDEVVAWSGFVLPSNVENLYIAAGGSTGVGNELNNVLRTNASGGTLIGGAGGDTLIDFGTGNNSFAFSVGSGNDTIIGFGAASGAGHDTVQLRNYGFTDFSQIQSRMTQVGADVVLKLTATDSITFAKTTLIALTADDFLLQINPSVAKQSFTADFDTLSLFSNSTNTGLFKTNYWFGDQNSGANNWSSRTIGGGEQTLFVDAGYTGGASTALGLNPFSVKNGVASLTVAKAPAAALPYLHGQQYTAGMLSTEKTFAQTYGYFEIKAQLPQDKGLWPSFWLLPANTANKTELDIFEQVGDDTSYSTVHTTDPNAKTTTFATYLPDADTGFHTYGMLWTEKEITFYVDGAAVGRMATPSDMHDPMYLIASMGAGGNWPGSLDPSFTSASMQIDYIHTYTLDQAAQLGFGNASIGTSDTLVGTAGDDRLFGYDGTDNLSGGAGNDYLDGGAKADTMAGGLGDDVYIVDDAGDVVRELVGEGNDEVRSYISYAISDNVEKLKLIGTMNLTGTGNGGNNVITGNDGDNILYGLAGNDTISGGMGTDKLVGGTGNDTYVIADSYADGSDTIVENANEGTDTVLSGMSYTLGANLENLTLTGTGSSAGNGNLLANTILGNDGANLLNGWQGDDILSGGGGNDIIIGDGGNDTLTGGTGDDIFRFGRWSGNDIITDFGKNGDKDVLDLSSYFNAGVSYTTTQVGNDVVIKFGNEGTIALLNVSLGSLLKTSTGFATADNVTSSVSATLPAGVHNLTLTGTAVMGTGNALDNVITGNAASNMLNGLQGADTMIGGDGNDWYTVDNVGDKVIEKVGEGWDTVKSSISYVLGDNLESINLTGTANIDGTGNAQINQLLGNSGANKLNGMGNNDYLDGLAGDDILTGGFGIDTFHFSPGSGKDVITDFGFDKRADIIDLTDFYKANLHATVTAQGADTLISFATGEHITVLDVMPDHLTATAIGYVFI